MPERDCGFEVVRLRVRCLPALVRRPVETLAECVDGRDAVRLHIGPQRLYVLNHPDLYRTVLEGDTDVFALPRVDPITLERLNGDSLPRLTGAAHTTRRAIVEPPLAAGSGRDADAIVAQAEARSSRWRDGSEVDLEVEMTDLAVDTICAVVFGEDHPALVGPTKALYALSRKVVGRLFVPGASLIWRLPLPLTRRFDSARLTLDRALLELVARRRAQDSTDGDLLSRLLAVRAPDGSSLTDEQVRDEIWTYVAQGAPVYALVWTWWTLASNPDAEALLHAELDEVLGDRPPAAGDLPALRVTQAVLLETLRLFPTSLGTIRRTTRAVELGRLRVPARAKLMVNYWALHHDGRFWTEPDRFDPHRWLDGERRTVPPYAYLAFSAGRRECPARSLATTQAVLSIAALARSWRARPLAGAVKVGLFPFVHPRGGLAARLESRRGPV